MVPGRHLFRRLRYGRPIIIVSGLPRSGTSMAMRMLEAGGLEIVTDRARPADDDNPYGYFEYDHVLSLDKGEDQGWLAGARGKAVKVVSALLPHLPERYQYRVIFMHRDLREVLVSQNKMLERRGGAGGTAGDDEMVRIYEGHLARVTALLRRRRCFETLDVRYADVLADPAGQARRIHQFLGGGLDAARMAEAVSPDLYRNRR
ncbi:hypothetical protein BH23ACI1_BH23ACI1_21810 [soil metagenome]